MWKKQRNMSFFEKASVGERMGGPVRPRIRNYNRIKEKSQTVLENPRRCVLWQKKQRLEYLDLYGNYIVKGVRGYSISAQLHSILLKLC